MLQKLSYSTQAATTFWSRQCYSHSYFIDKELVLGRTSSSPKATQQQGSWGWNPESLASGPGLFYCVTVFHLFAIETRKQDCMGYWAWPRMMSEWQNQHLQPSWHWFSFAVSPGSAVLWVTESRRKQQNPDNYFQQIGIEISFNHDSFCSNEMLLKSPIYLADKSELLWLRVGGSSPNLNLDPVVASWGCPMEALTAHVENHSLL